MSGTRYHLRSCGVFFGYFFLSAALMIGLVALVYWAFGTAAGNGFGVLARVLVYILPIYGVHRFQRANPPIRRERRGMRERKGRRERRGRRR